MLANIATKKRCNKKVEVKQDKHEHEESEAGETQQEGEGERAEVNTNETVYCICSSDSCTGPMILCDNEACSIEWFLSTALDSKDLQEANGKKITFYPDFIIINSSHITFPVTIISS